MHSVQEITKVAQNYAKALSATYLGYKQQCESANHADKQTVEALFMLDTMIAKTDLLIEYLVFIQKQKPQFSLAVTELIGKIDLQPSSQTDIQKVMQQIIQKINQDDYKIARPIISDFDFLMCFGPIGGIIWTLVLIANAPAMAFIIILIEFVLLLGIGELYVKAMARNAEEIRLIIRQEERYAKAPCNHFEISDKNHDATQEIVEETTVFRTKKTASQLLINFFTSENAVALREDVSKNYTTIIGNAV